MKPAEGEYQAGDFDSHSPGTFSVHGFEWFSLGENDEPILIAQRGGLVARARFNRVDDEFGPPGSFEFDELPALVKAFGGDVKQLPLKPALNQSGLVTQYLQAVQDLCRSGETEVVVNEGGWVRRVKGMDIPEAMYLMGFGGILPMGDNGPFLLDNRAGDPYFLFRLRVLAEAGGTESLYRGGTATTYMNYPLKVDEDGIPKYISRPKKGGDTAASHRMNKIITIFAPTWYEDYKNRVLIFADPHNVLPELYDYGVKSIENNVGVWSAVSIGDYGATFDVMALRLAKPEVVASAKGQEKRSVHPALVMPAQDDQQAFGVLKKLMACVLDIGEDEISLERSFLKTEGREFVKLILKPVKSELSTAVVKQFTSIDIRKILSYASELVETDDFPGFSWIKADDPAFEAVRLSIANWAQEAFNQDMDNVDEDDF